MEDYESVEIKKLYNLLWLNGGIIRDKRVKNIWKILWTTYQVSSVLLIFSSCTYFMLYTNEKSVHHLILTALSILIAIHNPSVISYVTRNFDKFTEFLHTIEPQTHIRSPRRKSITNNSIKTKTIIITITAMPFMMCAFNVLDFSGTSNPDFKDITRYFYPPFEFIGINSIPIYTNINLIQILTLLPTIFSYFTLLYVIEFFVHNLRYKFNKLQERIKISSKFMQCKMEASHLNELNLKKRNNVHASWIRLVEKVKRKKASLRFIQQMNKHVKKFNTLAQESISLKKLVQPILSFYVIFSASTLIITGHISLTAIKHPGVNKDHIQSDILALISFIFIFYKFGSLGTQLQEMIEKTSEVIYSTPWYLLSPQYRKNIHIFLCITQKNTSLMVFKMMPIDYTFLPSLLNSAYSYIMVLQTLMDRQH